MNILNNKAQFGMSSAYDKAKIPDDIMFNLGLGETNGGMPLIGAGTVFSYLSTALDLKLEIDRSGAEMPERVLKATEEDFHKFAEQAAVQADKLIAKCRQLIEGAQDAKKLAQELVEEPLTESKRIDEGNAVSGKLPAQIDSFLQDVAQMTDKISYTDIMNLNYTSEVKNKLQKLRREWIECVDCWDDDILAEIGTDVADVVKANARISESKLVTEIAQNNIPSIVRAWLEEVADATAAFSYTDVQNFRYNSECNAKLRKLRGAWADAEAAGADNEALQTVGRDVADVLKQCSRKVSK